MHGEIAEQELDRRERLSGGLGDAQIVTNRGHVARVRGRVHYSGEPQIQGRGRRFDLLIAIRRHWQMRLPQKDEEGDATVQKGIQVGIQVGIRERAFGARGA